MKIGFLGSKIRIDDIKEILSTLFTDITPVFIEEDLAYYQESVEKQLREIKPSVDGFIFSGEL